MYADTNQLKRIYQLCLAVALLLSCALSLHAEVPQQFRVWGKTGKDIQIRQLRQREIKRLKQKGRTPADIAEKNRRYDVRNWIEVQYEREKPDTVFTNQERTQGYVIFGRHYLDRVYYYTVPARDELVDRLQVFAAQGEYEPVTFSIHAFNPMQSVKAHVTDLHSAQGQMISTDYIDVRVVRGYPTPAVHPWWAPKGRDQQTQMPTKRIIPLVLEKHPSFAIPQDQTRQVWLTIKVPQHAKAGVYRGHVQLSWDDKQHSLPLSLRVLPFPLLTLDKAVYFSHVAKDVNSLIDYREHGGNVLPQNIKLDRKANRAIRNAYKAYKKTRDTNFIPPLPSVDQVFNYNKPRIQKSIQAARQANIELRYVYFSFYSWYISGWDKWFDYFPIHDTLDKQYIGLVNKITQYTRQQGFPQFIVVPGDEPGGHPENMPYIQHYLRLIKHQGKDTRSGITIGGGLSNGLDEIGLLEANLDVAITNYLDDVNHKRLKALGKEFWIYNVGSMTNDPQRDRHAYGFYCWKIDADGILQWAYRFGRPYYMAYRATPDWSAYVFESQEGKPLPTIHYEAFREAIDDQRYGATLAKLIKIAEKSNQKQAIEAATAAKQNLTTILANFNVDYMKKGRQGKIRQQFLLNRFDAETYDRYRWITAQHILTLRKALGPQAVLDPKEKGRPWTPASSSN